MSYWIIKDWAGFTKFHGRRFRTFENADEFLTLQIEKMYPETKDDEDEFYGWKDEYYITQEDE